MPFNTPLLRAASESSDRPTMEVRKCPEMSDSKKSSQSPGVVRPGLSVSFSKKRGHHAAEHIERVRVRARMLAAAHPTFAGSCNRATNGQKNHTHGEPAMQQNQSLAATPDAVELRPWYAGVTRYQWL